MSSGDWDFLAFAGSVHPHVGVIIIPRYVSIALATLYLEIAAATGEASAYANNLLVYPTLP